MIAMALVGGAGPGKVILLDGGVTLVPEIVDDESLFRDRNIPPGGVG